jgi:hypothetical protein
VALALKLAPWVASPKVTASMRSMQIPAFLAVLALRLALLALPRKHNTSLLPKSEAGGA